MSRTLKVSNPIMFGQDVREAQWILAMAGYLSLDQIDSQYGPTTAAAVAAYVADHHPPLFLTTNGQVDDALWGYWNAHIHVPSAYSSNANLALLKGAGELGYVEAPVNLTKYGEWYGEDGEPWCSIFVSWCYSLGAGVTLCNGYTGGPGVSSGVGCAYVPTVEQWLRANNYWLPLTAGVPNVGDIAIYNWGSGKPDHIGMVWKPIPGGFLAIEGNTSVKGSQTNGGAVMLRRRSYNKVDGFGRVP